MANLDTVRVLFPAELKRKLSDSPKTPFLNFANREYEGELKNGWDTVTVSVSPKIVMTDVSSLHSGDIRETSTDDITISARTITKDVLKIDTLHNYGEKFSDLEEIQTLYSINSNRMKDMVTAFNTTSEKTIIANLDAEATATHIATVSGGAVAPNNVASVIMKLRTKLSEAEIDYSNRVLVVSPALSACIAQAGILAGTNVAADGAVHGFLGTFAGFEIYESNLLTATTDAYCFKKGAYNYVRQLIKAKVVESDTGMYYNLLAQMAHGVKVFPQNYEQIVKLECTSIA